MARESVRAYVICTSPRSGSTLLCEMLRATGVAGAPDSHFHTPSLEAWLRCYDLSADRFRSTEDALRAVFEAARARGSGAAGPFGLRMQRASFPFFLAQVDRLHPGLASDAGRIRAAFGPTLFIHLHRSDKLAQAVSHVIAEQTGLWHRAADGSTLERVAPPRPPRYDKGAIARRMAELAAFDAEWRDWFDREGLTPLRIAYEELAEAPRRALGGVLEALGPDHAPAATVAPPTAKLADATSRSWIERFVGEGGGLSVFRAD